MIVFLFSIQFYTFAYFKKRYMIFLGYDFQKIFDTIASNFSIKTYIRLFHIAQNKRPKSNHLLLEIMI